MGSEDSLRAKRLVRLYGRFLRASEKHVHYHIAHIAAYADDARLQDLLECRVRRHSWDAFDLSSREFSDWFKEESNFLWIRIGRQTDLPIEPTDLDEDGPAFGPPTHAVQMPGNPWFGRFGPRWACKWSGGTSTFTKLAREAAHEFAGPSDDPTDPTGCWLGILYRLFPDQRSMLAFDSTDAASAFLPRDKIEIAWLPWNVFRTSAKAVKKLFQQDSLSVEPKATGAVEESSERTADSKTDTRKKGPPTLPDSPDVRDLCRLLQKHLPEGWKQIEIARKFTGEMPGDDRKAANLLRQARRFPHLWRSADT
jgi:hypothetical protein